MNSNGKHLEKLLRKSGKLSWEDYKQTDRYKSRQARITALKNDPTATRTMTEISKSGTILNEVQRERQVLDSTTSGASQETYAFGQDSNTAVQEVASTAMVGGTLPRHGQHCTYKTCL